MLHVARWFRNAKTYSTDRLIQLRAVFAGRTPPCCTAPRSGKRSHNSAHASRSKPPAFSRFLSSAFIGSMPSKLPNTMFRCGTGADDRDLGKPECRPRHLQHLVRQLQSKMSPFAFNCWLAELLFGPHFLHGAPTALFQIIPGLAQTAMKEDIRGAVMVGPTDSTPAIREPLDQFLFDRSKQVVVGSLCFILNALRYGIPVPNRSTQPPRFG